MTNREAIIEEAADAIRWSSEQGGWTDMARAALAVFEKAHTPTTTTDDERKALARAINPSGRRVALTGRAVDRVFAAGFRQIAGWSHCSPDLLSRGLDCASTPRRSCACEPENGGHDHRLPVLAAGFRRSEVPEPSAEHQGHMFCDRRLGCIRGELREAGKLSEPQAEPSDAQVEFPFTYGGVTLERDDGGVWVSDGGGSSYWISPRVLVALRAASEVGGEGR